MVCPNTVARLLKQWATRCASTTKKLAGTSHPNRDEQFRHITGLRERCAADNIPLISVDRHHYLGFQRFAGRGLRYVVA